MEWLIFALIAALLLTAVNFGDKFVVESQIRDPRVLLIVLPITSLAGGVVAWGLGGFMLLPLADAVPLLFSGLAIAGGVYFYFNAIVQTETSRIILLLQIEPLIVLILSMIFLDERLTISQLAGFALILIAVMAASLKPTEHVDADGKSTDMRVLLLMFTATMIWSGGVVAAGSVLERVVVDMQSLLVSIAYTNFGYLFGGIILYATVAPVRRAFHDYLPHFTPKAILSVSLLETTFLLRQMVFYQALSLGPVALVMIVSSLNVFFGVFAGWLLTIWRPHIFKENTSQQALRGKFALAGLAFMGLLLLG